AGGGRRIFTIEENTVRGGLADSASVFLSEYMDATRLTRIGLSDRFIPHGTRDELLKEEGLVPEEIAIRVIESFGPGRGTGQGGDR
ncbi:MAG TPA: transketolase C-terminal domain-containing protein, partial [Candidatus Krumholzibacterium sp.]|nr:transketolase C-terminal domain-containing protein [Candidatus Krumholzibacterium sp.]